MPVSPYIRRLRESIGNDLILLPSVSVLPRDNTDRILLVRQADTGRWGTIGGSVEIDEDPATAAVREAEEEAGVSVELTRLVTVLGGPQFRLTYPNGDQTAYVSIVYEARVVDGSPRPDADETLDVAWFARHELGGVDLGNFARQTFTALGLLHSAS
ncbi:NUDIX domain-containing protein [Actinobacteria bacterium YIM 96077]|uniref:NUDIX hydrolase n=1 Tax=Phytoactinopolyspora halophila TaxID=1981511 RepID=A0A329R0F0_9ACTN|nr:NUDIX domain-containing protein [Phytoactinopolyspora halophila]AYY11733.1 NUDIX domain-containing protein [Actinobacteria bacterium YIM 96077]RAW17833.1 NUDIX hydrolase [Phytoactinopolyspora halophila]